MLAIARALLTNPSVLLMDEEFAERAAVMDRGRIVYDGATQALRADADLLASLVAAE